MRPGPRLVPCPPALRARAAALVGADLADPPTVDGALLADLLPPGLRPGAGWPGGDDLVGLALSPRTRLVVVGDEVIGGCGPVGEPIAGCQEIGYGLAPGYHRRGWGTASIRLLADELLAEEGTDSLSAEMLEGNEPSWRSVERLGFRRVPTDRPGHRRYVLP